MSYMNFRPCDIFWFLEILPFSCNKKNLSVSVCLSVSLSLYKQGFHTPAPAPALCEAMAASISLRLHTSFLASDHNPQPSLHRSLSLPNPNPLLHCQTLRYSAKLRCNAVLASSPLQEDEKKKLQERQEGEEENDGRVYNFAAGPATLPSSVLKTAQEELYNWRGSGMSILEMSHRSKEFLSVIQGAESSLRSLLNIPDDYAVLFLQGGATTQFASVPLNLCKSDDSADYIVSGSWSDKAFKEAQKYCNAKSIWSGKSAKYTSLPAFGKLNSWLFSLPKVSYI